MIVSCKIQDTIIHETSFTFFHVHTSKEFMHGMGWDGSYTTHPSINQHTCIHTIHTFDLECRYLNVIVMMTGQCYEKAKYRAGWQLAANFFRAWLHNDDETTKP